MAPIPTTLGELVAAARSGSEPPWETWPAALVVVEVDVPVVDAPPLPWWWPAVVVGVDGGEAGAAAHPTCDLVVAADGDDLAAIEATVTANPVASCALTTLLRGSARRSVSEG